MAFSAFASGVTTQSGTDANLSGMAGLTDTNYVYSAQGPLRTVLMNQTGAKINVNGNLTIPLGTDELVFGTASAANQITVNSGGKLILDGQALSVAKQGYGIRAGRTSSDFFNASQSIITVNAGGAIEFLGSGVYVTQPLNIMGTVKVRNARARLGSVLNTLCMFRFTNSPTIDIDELDLIDACFVLDVSSATITSLKGLSITSTIAGTNNCAITTGIATTWIDPKFSGNINTHFGCMPQTGTARQQKIYGWAVGQAPLIGKVPDWTGAAQWVEGRKIIALTVRNVNQVAQQNVRTIFTDVNNGNRQNGSGVGAPNFTNSITYEVVSNASGLISVDVLLWECAGQLNGSAHVNVNKTVDYRWASNNVDAVITMPMKSYLNLPSSVNVQCGGFGQTVSQTTFLTPDAGVTLSEAAAAALTILATLSNVYDSVKNWSYQTANFLYPTATTQPLNASGKLINFGSQSLIIDSAAASVLSINTTTATVTVKSTTLAADNKFDELQASSVTVTSGTTVSASIVGAVTNAGTLSGTVTGNVVNTGTLASGASIIGNVTQATPTNMTGVTITGNLTYNTNTNTTITLTNCTISGTVSNSGTGTVTVRRSNSTIGTVGTNVVSQLVTSLTITGLTAGSSIYVANGSGVQQDYVASSGTSYTLDTTGGAGTWEVKVRRYGYQDQEFTSSPASSSLTAAATYITDIFVVDTLANVQAYTDLEESQKIYDYSRYYATTASGMALPPLFVKGFGTLTADRAYTTNPTAANLLEVIGGAIVSKTSGLDESVTIVVSGAYTQGAATLSNSVKIRATNLNSELLFSGVDSLTVYATQSNALNNTSPGATSATGIIRFLFGAALSGVTMSGTVYLRMVLGSVVQAQSLALVSGENEINLSTTTLLQSVNSKIDTLPAETLTEFLPDLQTINTGVQKSSLLVPHTTNI